MNKRNEPQPDSLPSAARSNFAAQIKSAWHMPVASFVRVGSLIAEARTALPTGEWAPFIKYDLPFGVRTAQRLMTVAGDPRITTHESQLPPCWTTLYLLTKLSDKEFQAGLARGTINPRMERSDAEALLGLQRANAVDLAADEDREQMKSARLSDPIDQARNAYLDLAQKAPTARRGHELWLLFAALGPTALEKFLRRTAKRKNADEQRILMAEALAAVRPDSSATDANAAT